ncbi:MAG: acyltransferase [Lachnospiraceae bacterium]|nr:acyltransferase [Lachnospiraceae bacterium]
MNDKERDVAFDNLKAFSAFLVIIIHVCAMEWRKIDIHSIQWMILHFYDMISKVSVVLFFMVSGRYFLDPSNEVTGRKIIQKIVRIVKAFIFWSAVYCVFTGIRIYLDGGNIRENLNWILVEFFTGEYHMWFLYAIAGLYLVTPFLRKITESKSLSEYFLVLFVLFGLSKPMLEKLPKVGVFLRSMNFSDSVNLVLGFAGYYVLGYYLYRYTLKKRQKKVLYFMGVLATIFTIVSTFIMTQKTGVANEELATYLTLNVGISSSAVYVFFLTFFEEKKSDKFVSIISKYSFGCYLVHPMFLWIFEMNGLVPSLFSPVISVPVIAGIVMVFSIVTSFIFSKLPILKEVV